MSVIRITKEFGFEAAHALKGYDGPCRNIHGHSYKLSVTIIGKPSEDINSPRKGMIMDFSDLKKIIKESIIDRFDHALILGADNKEFDFLHSNEGFSNVMLVDYQPTTENLLIDFAGRIRKLLPPNIRLHSLKLRETATSYAEWFAEDN